MRFRLDPFIGVLIATALFASFVPAHGSALDVLQVVTKIAVGLIFFLYGARLSTSEALTGLRHWRLHGSILSATFVIFPLLGIAIGLLVPSVLPKSLYAGVLLLCLMPSTVQSSVVFTSIARGNVAGAAVSASMSNLIGVFLTPLLVTLLMRDSGDAHINASAIAAIVLQLFVPFVVGNVLRPLIAGWVDKHDARLHVVDRAGILLIVYVAFSEGVNAHVWSSLKVGSLVALVVVCVVLLAVILGITAAMGRLLRFDRGDRIALLFCGSKKSLTSGLPMATVMFAGHDVALIVLPLMIFHQIQLIVCAWLAGRFARSVPSDR